MEKHADHHTESLSVLLDMGANVEQHPLDFTRLLHMHYQEMDYLIRSADLKAQLTMGINAILIASGLDFSIETFEIALGTGVPAIERITLGSELMVTLFLILSLAFSLMTIIPRKHGTKTHNLYFFADITKLDETEFIDEFMATPLDDIKRNVLAEIYAKAAIVDVKFRDARFSIICLYFATMFWVVSHIMPLFG